MEHSCGLVCARTHLHGSCGNTISVLHNEDPQKGISNLHGFLFYLYNYLMKLPKTKASVGVGTAASRLIIPAPK